MLSADLILAAEDIGPPEVVEVLKSLNIDRADEGHALASSVLTNLQEASALVAKILLQKR